MSTPAWIPVASARTPVHPVVTENASPSRRSGGMVRCCSGAACRGSFRIALRVPQTRFTRATQGSRPSHNVRRARAVSPRVCSRTWWPRVAPRASPERLRLRFPRPTAGQEHASHPTPSRTRKLIRSSFSHRSSPPVPRSRVPSWTVATSTGRPWPGPVRHRRRPRPATRPRSACPPLSLRPPGSPSASTSELRTSSARLAGPTGRCSTATLTRAAPLARPARAVRRKALLAK